jgi:GrpB-like predicted nucleotidyltransferase (UPF0157 family)
VTWRDGARQESSTASNEEPVDVVAYDPCWRAAYAAESARIRRELSCAGPNCAGPNCAGPNCAGPNCAEFNCELLGIEHIGSTAVDGLAAKPVIDIQVGVRSLGATSRIVEAMSRLGYIYVPELEEGMPNRRYFFKSAGGRQTHHVHLVERSDTDWWDRHIAFRDWLRGHPDDARAYAELKMEMASVHRNDRRAYTDAKTNFVNRILVKYRNDAELVR